jgi:hypothetical protein
MVPHKARGVNREANRMSKKAFAVFALGIIR